MEHFAFFVCCFYLMQFSVVFEFFSLKSQGLDILLITDRGLYI